MSKPGLPREVGAVLAAANSADDTSGLASVAAASDSISSWLTPHPDRNVCFVLEKALALPPMSAVRMEGQRLLEVFLFRNNRSH